MKIGPRSRRQCCTSTGKPALVRQCRIRAGKPALNQRNAYSAGPEEYATFGPELATAVRPFPMGCCPSVTPYTSYLQCS